MEQAIADRAGEQFEAATAENKLLRDLPSRQSFWLVAHADQDVVVLLPGTTLADGAAYAACPRIPNRLLALAAGKSRGAMRRRHRRAAVPMQYQIGRDRFDAAIGMARRAS